MLVYVLDPDNTRGPIYLYRLTLIPAGISYLMRSKKGDSITYLFLNLNGCTVKVTMHIYKLIAPFFKKFNIC